MLNAAENMIWLVIFAFLLMMTSIVVFIGDIMLIRTTTYSSQIVNDTIGSARYEEMGFDTTWSYGTGVLATFVDAANFFAVIIIAVLIISSVFSPTNLMDYLVGILITLIVCGILMYLTVLMFAYIYAVLNDLTVDGVVFTYVTYPNWLRDNLINFMAVCFISFALGTFLRPQTNVGKSQVIMG